MITRRQLIAGAIATASCPRSAHAAAPSIRRLNNGLTVAVEEDHRAPRVGVAVAYRVGQRDDPPGYRGLAHMVEHLMFQGSTNVGDDGHFLALEQHGVTDQGGFTGLDRTIYFEELPRRAWPVALWLESDRMAYMLRRANAASLAMHREVIRNEWRQRGGDNAIPNRFALSTQLLYPNSHPYYVPVDNLGRGRDADLDAIGLREVQWFFQRFYRPELATVAIVGDVNAADAHRVAEAYFGSIRSIGPTPPMPAAPMPRFPGLRVGTVKTYGDRGALVLAWPTASLGAVEDAALDVIAQHLARRDGPLWRPLVTSGLALDARARQASGELGSLFFIDVTTLASHSLAQVRQRVDAALATLATNGLSAGRVAQLVDELVLDLEMSAEQPSARARHLARRLTSFDAETARYRSLDRATIHAVIRQVLRLDQRAILLVQPTPRPGDQPR
jgi:zinc protease